VIGGKLEHRQTTLLVRILTACGHRGQTVSATRCLSCGRSRAASVQGEGKTVLGKRWHPVRFRWTPDPIAGAQVLLVPYLGFESHSVRQALHRKFSPVRFDV